MLQQCDELWFVTLRHARDTSQLTKNVNWVSNETSTLSADLCTGLRRAYAEFGANEMLQVVELETRAGALARRDSARQHRTQRLALSQDAHPGE